MATAEQFNAAAILQAVQQSAQAATAAALALKEANERRTNNFGEASKIVQCPKEFGNQNSTEDQTAWSDFSFTFRQWLFFADPAYENDFKQIEEHPSAAVVFAENAMGAASKERSRKLYSIFGWDPEVQTTEGLAADRICQWVGSLPPTQLFVCPEDERKESGSPQCAHVVSSVFERAFNTGASSEP